MGSPEARSFQEPQSPKKGVGKLKSLSSASPSVSPPKMQGMLNQIRCSYPVMQGGIRKFVYGLREGPEAPKPYAHICVRMHILLQEKVPDFWLLSGVLDSQKWKTHCPE